MAKTTCVKIRHVAQKFVRLPSPCLIALVAIAPIMTRRTITDRAKTFRTSREMRLTNARWLLDPTALYDPKLLHADLLDISISRYSDMVAIKKSVAACAPMVVRASDQCDPVTSQLGVCSQRASRRSEFRFPAVRLFMPPIAGLDDLLEIAAGFLNAPDEIFNRCCS